MRFTPENWIPALFQDWDAAGIRYVVLRNYENLPHDPGNDMDVLVSAEHNNAALEILQRCVTRFGGIQHHQATFACDSIFLHDPVTLRQYHVDLFDALLWRSFLLIDGDCVLNRRRDHRGIFVPKESDEALLNLLTRLLYGGEIREKYQMLILQQTDEPDFRREIQRTVGKRLAEKTIAWIQANAWSRIEAATNRYRLAVAVQACMKRPTAVLCTTAKDFFRLLYRIIRSPGLFIVLVGPDGCGKTSVGLALRKCLAGTFYTDNGLHLHWKARLINRPSNPTGTPCADPHGKPVRPNMESIAFFSAHVLEMIVAHEVKVRPVLFKNGLVLVERYYYDFFVDPRRYCLNIPQWLVKVLYRFVPKPDIVFFFRRAGRCFTGTEKGGLIRRVPKAARSVSCTYQKHSGIDRH